MTEVLVLGAGNWGTTFAILSALNNLSTSIYVRDKSLFEQMRDRLENSKYLPGIDLPENLEYVNEPTEALKKAKVIVFAIPTNSTRSFLQEYGSYILKESILLSLSKGIEKSTGLRVSEVFHQILPSHNKLGVLTGPNIAREIASGKPAVAVISSRSPRVSKELQSMFSCPNFRIYTNPDLTGIEICGSLKNIIAIGAGICHELNLGDNAIAALITRGIAEIARFGQAFGANPNTFMGMAGVGDLTVTCMSPLSRNNTLGRLLAKGMSLQEARDSMKMVTEGVFTCQIVEKLAGEHGIYMPITGAIHRILFESVSPRVALKDLMENDLKDEILSI